MAKIDLLIPSLENKFVDLRESISGDAYNFSWVRELSEINYLAIHHSSSSDAQTPEEIAQFHINNNGWGGIGYHFLISKDGTTFYVGDISTARANVANLNEQVIGICLIGNFTSGVNPSVEQLESAHKLCEFLINDSRVLNVNSWDKVRGHKDLPGQSTNCPGDDWESWRIQIVEGIKSVENSEFTKENAEDVEMLQSQVNNLQSSLASVNQQLIFLQETLQDRDKEINELKSIDHSPESIEDTSRIKSADTTLTIVGALINLYKFLTLPRKANSDSFGI